MAEQLPIQAGPETELVVPRADPSKLHLVSGIDAIEAASPDLRLDAILARGDIRDQAAERRDRRAECRFPGRDRGHAGTDRDWAGRDRDSAAADRADIVGLLRAKQGIVLVIDKVQGILMARRGCTPGEAFSLLSTAAQQNELSLDEMAECIVAELHLR
jgi:hypothetical protein